MVAPQGYTGPSLEIIVRTTKPDNTDEALAGVFSHLDKDARKVALFQKDQSDGEFTDATLNQLRDRNLGRAEMKTFMEAVNMVKIESEVENLQVAARFVKWTFDNVVNEIEDIIDAERKIKHTQIQGKVEKMAEKPETMAKFLAQFTGAIKPDQSLFEYPIPVLIQSGTQFTVNKFNVNCDTQPLNDETIYVNVCGKYRDMNLMASRTFLVNPEAA